MLNLKRLLPTSNHRDDAFQPKHIGSVVRSLLFKLILKRLPLKFGFLKFELKTDLLSFYRKLFSAESGLRRM